MRACDGSGGRDRSARYRGAPWRFRSFARLKEFSCEGGSSDSPFAETDGVVVNLRAVKDADEIRRMRAAQAITDAAFAHIIAFMKPGMTEREVQLELEDFMVRNGASGLAFSSIVATGANGRALTPSGFHRLGGGAVRGARFRSSGRWGTARI